MALLWKTFIVLLAFLIHSSVTQGLISRRTFEKISKINKEGPYVGVVVPNSFEMNPLLQSASFKANQALPYLDFSGRPKLDARTEYQTHDLQLIHSYLSNIPQVSPEVQQHTAPNIEYRKTSLGWYQPKEVFPINGTTEVRQHAFWVPVSKHYLELSKKLEGLKLERCVNSTTCPPREPMVVTVSRGVSAGIFVDNAAYRNFIYSKFNAAPIDMESAGIALVVCLQQRVPFIVFRSLSDLAGGGSNLSNEANTYTSVAARNSVSVAVKFIESLL